MVVCWGFGTAMGLLCKKEDFYVFVEVLRKDQRLAVRRSRWLVCLKCNPENVSRKSSCSLKAFWTMGPRRKKDIYIVKKITVAIIKGDKLKLLVAVRFTAFFDTFLHLIRGFDVKILENKSQQNMMEKSISDLAEMEDPEFLKILKELKQTAGSQYEARGKTCTTATCSRKSALNKEDYTDFNQQYMMDSNRSAYQENQQYGQYNMGTSYGQDDGTAGPYGSTSYSVVSNGSSRQMQFQQTTFQPQSLVNSSYNCPFSTTNGSEISYTEIFTDKEYLKRKRNNESAKRSRAKKQKRYDEMEKRNKELEDDKKLDNAKKRKLRQRVKELEKKIIAKDLEIFELRLSKMAKK